MPIFPPPPGTHGQPAPLCHYVASTARTLGTILAAASLAHRAEKPIGIYLRGVSVGVGHLRTVLDGGISRPWQANTVAKTPLISGAVGGFSGERRSLIRIEHCATQAGRILAGLEVPGEPALETSRRHLITASRWAYSLASEYAPANDDLPLDPPAPLLTKSWRYALDTRAVADDEADVAA